MNLRSRKITALLLSAAMVFSFNTAAAAEEVITEEIDGAYLQADGYAQLDEAVDPTSLTSYTSAANALSGNVTINFDTPEPVNVELDRTTIIGEVKKAIANEMEFVVEKSNRSDRYFVDNDCLIRKSDKAVIQNGFSECLTVSFDNIRTAGQNDGKKPNVSKNGLVITDTIGNQLLSFKATLNTSANRIPGAKKCNTVEGEMLLRSHYSGSVSSENVEFKDGDKTYRMVVTFDAAVEYRGSRVTATSHYLTTDTDAVSGEVDGAVGVSACLEVLSGNKWYPIDKDNNSYDTYFWKDDTGINLKKPKIYNNTKMGCKEDQSGPYFKIKMSYKKKQVGDKDLLSQSAKAALKSKLDSQKFYFTLEPRRLSTGLITYNKFEPNKYYVSKLTYKADKGTLKGAIQYRGQKKNKSTLNARKLRKLGKKLKLVKKNDSGKYNKKMDAAFEYKNDKIYLSGVNGYYGSAVIEDTYNGKTVIVKK